MAESNTTTQDLHIYDGNADLLMEADRRADRVVLMPAGDPRSASAEPRIRIQWGQHLLSDLLTQRYRTVVCGVNPEDNTHGVISQLSSLLPTSQWNDKTMTHYARFISEGGDPDEVYVLKFDLDRVEVLALLRPRGQKQFTLEHISKGFRIVAQMLEGRYDRLPVASVSFLGAKSNRLVDAEGNEPSFESVLRTMYGAGYHGDVYPAPGMWELAPTGVFASYPFPESLDRMRAGGF